jgi:hypothetical protein
MAIRPTRFFSKSWFVAVIIDSDIFNWHCRHAGRLRFSATYSIFHRVVTTNTEGRTNYCTTLLGVVLFFFLFPFASQTQNGGGLYGEEFVTYELLYEGGTRYGNTHTLALLSTWFQGHDGWNCVCLFTLGTQNFHAQNLVYLPSSTF